MLKVQRQMPLFAGLRAAARRRAVPNPRPYPDCLFVGHRISFEYSEGGMYSQNLESDGHPAYSRLVAAGTSLLHGHRLYKQILGTPGSIRHMR